MRYLFSFYIAALLSSSAFSQVRAYSRSPKLIYSEDFSGEHGWIHYQWAEKLVTEPIPACCGICFASYGRDVCAAWSPIEYDKGNPHVVSRGPWWVDTNHKNDGGVPTGGGYLNLISFVYVNGLYGSGITNHNLDLRNTRLRFRMRTEQLNLKGAHIYFWFQRYDSTLQKFTNFIMSGVQIECLITPGVWTSISLILQDHPSTWQCIGTSVWRESTYTCQPIEDALKDVNTDLGFIILPLNPYDAFNNLYDNLPSGTVRVDDVSISRLPALIR